MLERGEQVKDVVLADLFDAFMTIKRTNQKAAMTLRRYASLVKLYLQPAFGSLKAKELRPLDLTRVYSNWLEHGRDGNKVSPRTVRHAHELFRNILRWGVRKELLTRNVAALIEDDDLPKVVEPKPLALTNDELRKVLAEAKNPSSRSKKRGYMSAQPWFHPAVTFAAYTGCRRGETLEVAPLS